MSKLTLTDVVSGYAVVSAYNANNTAIETALENTLSRDGTAPNAMGADLDMNGHRILNLLAISGETNFIWKGTWGATTSYTKNNLVYVSSGTYQGYGMICTVSHTSAATFDTDGPLTNWAIFVQRGAVGASTGDMLKSENLSGLANYTTARSNLGATATGESLFTAASAAVGRSTLGLTIGVAAGNIEQVDQAVTATTRSATTTLGTSLNHTLSASGTTITAFNGVAGITYHCRALGVGEITHHATNLIITQGGTAVNTAVGDTFDVEMLTGTTCRIKNYESAALRSKVVADTHDVSNVGTQDFVGVGFYPRAVTIYACIDSVSQVCWGMADGTSNECVINTGATVAMLSISNYCIALSTNWGVTSAQATMTLSADGGQLTWAKTGSPTGIAKLKLLFHR